MNDPLAFVNFLVHPGNVIASRTQNLFRQYSKDMVGPSEENKNSTAEELKAVKLQYQERLATEEREKEEERKSKMQYGVDSTSRKSLGGFPVYFPPVHCISIGEILLFI